MGLKVVVSSRQRKSWKSALGFAWRNTGFGSFRTCAGSSRCLAGTLGRSSARLARRRDDPSAAPHLRNAPALRSDRQMVRHSGDSSLALWQSGQRRLRADRKAAARRLSSDRRWWLRIFSSVPLEYREGKGMVLFCQMDVTDAPKLIRRRRSWRTYLSYIDDWKPAPRRTVVFAGDAEGKQWLRACGIEAGIGAGAFDRISSGDGPGAEAALARSQEAISAFTGAGGHFRPWG